MAQARGSATQMIYDQEATFGVTPASPDAKTLYFISEGLSAKRGINKSNVIRGNRNAVKPTRGNKDAGGNINTELSPYMGTILKHLLGSVATTGAGANKTHTIKVGSLPVGLCLEKGFTDISQFLLYNGCRINKASLEFNSEGVIPFNLDFLAKKRTASGSSFDTTPVDLGHVAWDMMEATIEEGGSSIAIITKTTMDIENDLDGGSYVIGGQGERVSIPEGSLLVSGVVTAFFQDLTLLNKAINFTESSLRIILTRGTGDGTAGNEYFEVKVPELIYEEKDPIVTGPKGVLVELPYAAYYDNSSEASSIQMVLKNTQATL